MSNITITQQQVEDIYARSEIRTDIMFDKCLVLTCRLPNGFVLVESSACVDPKNFSAEIGHDICKGRILNHIWELEGYRLQCEIGKDNNDENCN